MALSSHFEAKPLGVLRIYKTRRYVVLFERLVACWGDVQLYCVIYDRRLYEAKTKAPIYRMIKGSYLAPEQTQQGEVKPIALLKHIHQRLRRNGVVL